MLCRCPESPVVATWKGRSSQEWLPYNCAALEENGVEHCGCYFFRDVSKSLKMRLYSSVQLEGWMNPWSSTG